MMGLLAYLFFSWFNQNRRSGTGFTVFLYGISSVALVLNTVIGLASLYTLSRYESAILGPRVTNYVVVISSPIDSILNTLYIVLVKMAQIKGAKHQDAPIKRVRSDSATPHSSSKSNNKNRYYYQRRIITTEEEKERNQQQK
jgi:hypothetical protein